jgi:hypothetical protein
MERLLKLPAPESGNAFAGSPYSVLKTITAAILYFMMHPSNAPSPVIN